MTQGALDLQGIFKDEIRANFKDNVYAALGNKLQLDGEAYVQVARALATRDFLDIIRTSPMPERDRQGLMNEQTAKTESAFLAAVESLDWPKYSVDLEAREIRVTGPLNLNLYARKNQPVLFVLHNSSASPETVRIASEEIRIPITQVNVEPHSRQYLLGSAAPQENGDQEIKVSFATDKYSREVVVAAKVEETVLLDGVLVTDGAGGGPTRCSHPSHRCAGKILPAGSPTVRIDSIAVYAGRHKSGALGIRGGEFPSASALGKGPGKYSPRARIPQSRRGI